MVNYFKIATLILIALILIFSVVNYYSNQEKEENMCYEEVAEINMCYDVNYFYDFDKMECREDGPLY